MQAPYVPEDSDLVGPLKLKNKHFRMDVSQQSESLQDKPDREMRKDFGKMQIRNRHITMSKEVTHTTDNNPSKEGIGKGISASSVVSCSRWAMTCRAREMGRHAN